QMPLISGNLDSLLSTNPDYLIRKKLCYDYTLSLQALHRSNYLHLDVSSRNCFYQNQLIGGSPKGILGDYGLAQAVQKSSKDELILKTHQGAAAMTYLDPLIEN